ncbi:MAG: T9SS type A sorting domain-containing protein [Crocinitomicaceae bacterium]|nr:T9SS type A sorting domain-containing protein [Crocinitomicaceae bacterium]
MKKLIFILLAWSSLGFAQPALNEWYPLNSEQTQFNSVFATDSCYYLSGTVRNQVDPNVWDQTFVRIDTLGNVISQKILHSDSVSIYSLGANLIENHGQKLVTLCSTGLYYLLCEYSPTEDSVYVHHLDSTFFYHGFKNGAVSTVYQKDLDSSYFFAGQLSDTLTGDLYFGYFKCNKDGNLIKFNKTLLETGYYTWIPGDVLDVNDGLIFTSFFNKIGAHDTLSRKYTRIIKTNYNLDTLWTWTDWQHKWDSYSNPIVSTSDNGFIYGGTNGEYLVDNNAVMFRSQIVKIDSNMDREWDLFMYHYDADQMFTKCTDIIKIGVNEFVGVGHRFTDTLVQGWMIKFDGTGNIIWDSYFSYVGPPYDNFNGPTNQIYNVQQTTDGGYVLCGNAWDPYLFGMGQPSQFAWLLKTDSVGCLVPGCQQYGSITENPTLELLLYPNPTANNLFVYLPEFSSDQNEVFRIHDLSGKMLMEWPANLTNNTYIVNVEHLASGHYILSLEGSNGVLASEKFVVE